jgi:signal transduction histidine kinase
VCAFVVTIPTGITHLPADQISTRPTDQKIAPSALPYVEEALRWLPTLNEANEAIRMEPVYSLPLVAPFSGTPQNPTKRILLADDNLDLREYVTQMLAPYYTVESVADGQAALEAALVRPPDLVLTDVMMPRLDGFALLKALRADPRTRTVPVIVLSARAGEEASLEGMDAGADDYLSKPFSTRELLTRVRAHLNLRQIRQETEEQLRHFNEMLEKGIAQRTAELVQRNQDLDRFAYVASHDLKSPLRAIDNLAHWIAEDTRELLPAASQEHLHKMRSRVKRMEKLLDDLLVYSRSGRHQYPTELVDIAKLIDDIVNLLAIPEAFLITTETPLPVVVTARVPLEVVLRNLLANAIKHHERADGKVLITAHDQGDVIEFTVQDDGPGIAEKYHKRIFEIFQTLKPRDVMEGSGMGLAIVKRIVESRGGTISVTSAEGQGATFRFTWSKEAARPNPQEQTA